MTDATCLALALARWFEARLHESFVPHSALARLYAVDVLDRDALGRGDVDGARTCFVAEAPSVAALRDLPASARVLDHDGAIIVTTRWVPWPEGVIRPGEFSTRRRARVVHVSTDDGVAGVARFDDLPDVVVLHPAA